MNPEFNTWFIGYNLSNGNVDTYTKIYMRLWWYEYEKDMSWILDIYIFEIFQITDMFH